MAFLLASYASAVKRYKHGDILYAVTGEPAAVVTGISVNGDTRPWNIRGRRVWLAVGVAAKRGVNLHWNDRLGEIDEITNTIWPGSFRISSSTTEEYMDSIINDTGTSDELTAKILEYAADPQAASWCNDIVLENGMRMDLPSMDALMRIFKEADLIDSIDPTASTNTSKKLSNWGFNSTKEGVWSSCEANSTSSWAIPPDGFPYAYNPKTEDRGVIPVLELLADYAVDGGESPETDIDFTITPVSMKILDNSVGLSANVNLPSTSITIHNTNTPTVIANNIVFTINSPIVTTGKDAMTATLFFMYSYNQVSTRAQDPVLYYEANWNMGLDSGKTARYGLQGNDMNIIFTMNDVSQSWSGNVYTLTIGNLTCEVNSSNAGGGTGE